MKSESKKLKELRTITKKEYDELSANTKSKEVNNKNNPPKIRAFEIDTPRDKPMVSEEIIIDKLINQYRESLSVDKSTSLYTNEICKFGTIKQYNISLFTHIYLCLLFLLNLPLFTLV